MRRYEILLGGIGADSHSVGLNIIKHALKSNNYDVRYLGTQNNIEDFFRNATYSNVIMISCMDGHSSKYLHDFPKFKQIYKPIHKKWYLGGNITLGNDIEAEEKFLEMGFDKVFPKFIDIKSLLHILKNELIKNEYIKFIKKPDINLFKSQCLKNIEVDDQKINKEAFLKDRKVVLEQWKTGREAKSIEENAEFLSKQKNFSNLQSKVNKNINGILIQPRCGVATIKEQLNLFRSFKYVGCKVLSYQVDSLTRNNIYELIDSEIKNSQLQNKSTLNGFPIINHGVNKLRRITSDINIPLQTRHSTRDPRLLSEISFAGGVTSYEGGAICYNIPYYKNYPLDEAIKNWQYVDYLTGYYFENYGIVLDREFFGTLTGTLIPPSIAIVICIFEAILAAQQGVKSVSLGYAEQGNRTQDIAAIRVMAKLSKEILSNLGYSDVNISTVFHQYMAAFPSIPHMAEELILESAVTAKLSGATRILTKTPVEATQIPNEKDNLQGISLVKKGISKSNNTKLNNKKILMEENIINEEVNSIFNSVIMVGGGNIVKGIINAFKKGFLDIPFSPSVFNRGDVIAARDTSGAIRFASTGNLQLNNDIKKFHEEKMSERRRVNKFHSNDNYLLVEEDVMKIPRAQYEQWPLCKSL